MLRCRRTVQGQNSTRVARCGNGHTDELDRVSNRKVDDLTIDHAARANDQVAFHHSKPDRGPAAPDVEPVPPGPPLTVPAVMSVPPSR